jgi:hypothetical protein
VCGSMPAAAGRRTPLHNRVLGSPGWYRGWQWFRCWFLGASGGG